MNANLIDLAKAVAGPVATVLLAWAVGNRLSNKWAVRQKLMDDARGAANEFYKLYGEFFAVWKLWNYTIRNTADPDGAARRWELLKRAASAEAGIEAFLVKLTSERSLGKADVEALGRFRQGYQVLRQAIRDANSLDWGSSEHPEYFAFKRLASRAGRLVSTVDQGEAPTISAAQQALLSVTSNVWEGRWHAEVAETS